MSIAIIFGGRSCEHNVSVVTGVQILNAVRALDPLPIYIDKNGEWRTGELYDLEAAKEWKKLKSISAPGLAISVFRTRQEIRENRRGGALPARAQRRGRLHSRSARNLRHTVYGFGRACERGMHG